MFCGLSILYCGKPFQQAVRSHTIVDSPGAVDRTAPVQLAPVPRSDRYAAPPLDHDIKMAGLELGKPIDRPRRPPHIHYPHVSLLPEPEMEAPIVASEVAPAGLERSVLAFFSSFELDTDADAFPVRPYPDELKLHPVPSVASVVSEERGLRVQIRDKDVEVAVIVDVPVGGAAPQALLAEAYRARNVLELLAVDILE